MSNPETNTSNEPCTAEPATASEQQMPSMVTFKVDNLKKKLPSTVKKDNDDDWAEKLIALSQVPPGTPYVVEFAGFFFGFIYSLTANPESVLSNPIGSALLAVLSGILHQSGYMLVCMPGDVRAKFAIRYTVCALMVASLANLHRGAIAGLFTAARFYLGY